MHAFFAMLTLALGAPTASPSTHEAALAAYGRKEYARACRLFAEAARAEPENGAIWADLGLCELKRSRKAESVRASMRAVLLGDEKTRTNAYFNLGLAGAALPLPPLGRCTVWQAPEELGCTQRVEACHVEGVGTGYKGQGRSSYAVLGRCDEACPRASVPKDATEVPPAPALDERTGQSGNVALRVSAADDQEVVAEFQEEDGTTTRMSGTGPTLYTDCSVVVVDPCRGRAGLSCAYAEDNDPGTRKIQRGGEEQVFHVP